MYLCSLVASLWLVTGEGFTGEIDLINAISRVAKAAIPAVVHIDVIHREQAPNPWLPFKNDPFFRFFFDVPDMAERFEKVSKAIGTGFIIDEIGHVVTNYHVIAGAKEIEVLLSDGRRYPAKVAGVEVKTDLAVLKITKEGKFPYLKLGNSDKVEVGEWVVAIGHPRGLDHTVTQGIISAKHRTGVLDPNSYQDFLQTDAAINPGNSGGPLLNLKGEVIGINSAIVSRSGGYEGIGFAIPSNIAAYVTEQIIKNGKVRRGWVGMSVQDLTPALAERLGIEAQGGALVIEVEPGGPAEKAGIKKWDVVQKFGSRPIRNSVDLQNVISLGPVGEKVDITVLRQGMVLVIPVIIEAVEQLGYGCKVVLRKVLGAELRPMKEEESLAYGIERGKGLVVCYIDQKGPMGNAGLEVRDLILEINGIPVSDPMEVARMLQDFKGDVLTLLAMDHRSGRKGYVQVRIK